jgi:hypothetical protein
MTQEELDKLKLVARNQQKRQHGDGREMAEIGAGSHRLKVYTCLDCCRYTMIYGFYNTVMKAIDLFK